MLDFEVDLRREATSVSTTPVDGITDYGEAMALIESSVRILNESLPNGQMQRTRQAYLALKSSLCDLEVYLRAKGHEL